MMTDKRPKLVKYRGCYWFWRGLKDYTGRLILTDIIDNSAGVTAPATKSRIVEGDEYERQMNAIEAFKFRALFNQQPR